MKTLAAMAVGYLIGAKTGDKDLEQLSRSLEALFGTDEFSRVVTAARSQLGATLREIAELVDGSRHVSDTGGDLVAKVRHLVGHD